MGLTDYNVADAQGLVQDFWAPLVEKERREQALWLGILQDPNYTLEKVKGGDTYKITQINYFSFFFCVKQKLSKTKDERNNYKLQWKTRNLR